MLIQRVKLHYLMNDREVSGCNVSHGEAQLVVKEQEREGRSFIVSARTVGASGPVTAVSPNT